MPTSCCPSPIHTPPLPPAYLFFFNDTPTPEIYPLPLPDALPISAFTLPDLVERVVPSASGSRSRCTPWPEPSAPIVSLRLVILSTWSRSETIGADVSRQGV